MSTSRIGDQSNTQTAGRLALKAVIFDYGLVLTGPQDPQALRALIRITGLDPDTFHRLYWADRHMYDEGGLTGIAYWEKILSETGLPPNPGTISELIDLDASMWMTENAGMLRWHGLLKAAGLKTAILSNMGDEVAERIERELAWINRFDVRVWSYQLLMVKPDPRIYTRTLDLLGIEPGDALFLDDRLVNIEAARALGMQGLVFSTMEQLRSDLLACGFDAELPLPA
jgi:putative hydrolase of the HAD superfamily